MNGQNATLEETQQATSSKTISPLGKTEANQDFFEDWDKEDQENQQETSQVESPEETQETSEEQSNEESNSQETSEEETAEYNSNEQTNEENKSEEKIDWKTKYEELEGKFKNVDSLRGKLAQEVGKYRDLEGKLTQMEQEMKQMSQQNANNKRPNETLSKELRNELINTHNFDEDQIDALVKINQDLSRQKEDKDRTSNEKRSFQENYNQATLEVENSIKKEELSPEEVFSTMAAVASKNPALFLAKTENGRMTYSSGESIRTCFDIAKQQLELKKSNDRLVFLEKELSKTNNNLDSVKNTSKIKSQMSNTGKGGNVKPKQTNEFGFDPSNETPEERSQYLQGN